MHNCHFRDSWRLGLKGKCFLEVISKLVLRLDFNMDREEASRGDAGNAFHIVGAWYEKDLCPWDLVLTFGITRRFIWYAHLSQSFQINPKRRKVTALKPAASWRYLINVKTLLYYLHFTILYKSSCDENFESSKVHLARWMDLYRRENCETASVII